MRTLLASLLMVSVQAFACPDLAGTYTCTLPSGETEVVNVTQSINPAGDTVYMYNQMEFTADNTVRTLPDSDKLKDATARAWCEDPALKVEVIGKYFQNGTYTGDLSSIMTVTLDINRHLNMITTGTLKSGPVEYPVNQDMTCSRHVEPTPLF